MGFVIRINGHFFIVDKKLTIIEACESAGCFVPRFCYQPILSIAGNCRMCLVRVFGANKPVVSCTVFVSGGLVVYTNRFFVTKAQERVVEFLLLSHPLDCPVCDQGGMCDLQDQSYSFGSDSRRFFGLKRSVIDKNLGPVVGTVINRCIQCTRCVRFVSEYNGSFWGSFATIIIAGRGSFSEITTYSHISLVYSLSGNVIDLCPVGALTKKTYSFIGRPWERRNTIRYDLSSSSINKVYFSVLVDGGFCINVRSVNGSWISNQTRFSYDAFEFIPCSLRIPGTFKLPERSSIVLGGGLSLSDLSAIFFYFEGLGCDVQAFSVLPISDKTRSVFWGYSVESSLKSFDLIILVGAGVSQISPNVYAEVREAFYSGSFIVHFGPIGIDFMLVFGGNRFGDFIRFVLGYHECCLSFSKAVKPIILFTTGLFSSAHSSLWLVLIDKLRSFGYVVRFINIYANEVAYSYSGAFDTVSSFRYFFKKKFNNDGMLAFGYLGVFITEFLWVNSISIEFYCGCWPLGSRMYQRLPLLFQRASVCTPQGEVVSLVPLVGNYNFLFEYSVSDILLLTSNIKYWSVPLFAKSNIFVIQCGWVEPLDFYVQSAGFNCLIQFPVGWSPLSGWVENSNAYRQVYLYSECIEFNFL
jgi:hypothetical protein